MKLTTDPDYGVGFVFFREVMRAVSMRGGEALLSKRLR